MLNAAVIGLGIGEQHIRAYKTLPDVDVSAICDLDENKLSLVGEKYLIDKRYTDGRHIIDDPSIDIVSIATYDETHAKLAVSAIENGKHVFVDKPLCMTPEEADSIRLALQAAPDLKMSSNLPLRTCPRFVELRHQIQNGGMGRVYHVEADYLWGRPHKLLEGWRRDMSGYSIVLGASIHMIDLVAWVTGQIPVEVFGYGSRKVFADHNLGFDDFAVHLFRFADGTCAKVGAHGGGAHPHYHDIRVFGSGKSFHHKFDGAYWIDGCDPELQVRPEISAYPAKDQRGRILTSFVEHIQGSPTPPLVTAYDSFTLMNIAFAAERSISEGQPQPIPAINEQG